MSEEFLQKIEQKLEKYGVKIILINDGKRFIAKFNDFNDFFAEFINLTIVLSDNVKIELTPELSFLNNYEDKIMGSFFVTQNKKKQLSFIYENSVDEEQIFLVID